MAAVLEAFPRLDMKQQFKCAVCGIVERRPDTTYDNFARDFGERFVAGYKAPSTVEFREVLARTATGKLQKFKLRAPYWEGRDRAVN